MLGQEPFCQQPSRESPVKMRSVSTTLPSDMALNSIFSTWRACSMGFFHSLRIIVILVSTNERTAAQA